MFNLQFTLDYVKHRLEAKNRHGVHSPFVYRLIDEVIYDFSLKDDYCELEAFRRALMHDERPIVVNDQEISVKEFVKNKCKPVQASRLIYRLANYFSANQIIELGTSMGVDTAYLMKAVPQAKIIVVDHHDDTVAITSKNLINSSAQSVQVLRRDQNHLLPIVNTEPQSLDFLLMNRSCRKEVSIKYLNQCLPLLKETSVVVVDAIYRDEEMKICWQQIKAHSQITVTIDLFQLGLAFVRPQQAEEHFKIRF